MTKKEKDAEKFAKNMLELEQHLGIDLRPDELMLLALFASVINASEDDEKEEEKEKISDALHDQLARHIANSNYGLATRSCDDDEKLVVLCMIDKTLKDMQDTLEGIQETLARIDDKI